MLSHACGAAFDNPDLIVAAVVGDGEAETGPLATSWHINKFLNPIRDGAVLPILHLNGYKINNPTLLARISHEEVENLFQGYGWTPYFVEGSDPDSMHQAMAATVEHCVSEIRKYQQEARTPGVAKRPRWPMIVLRTPKGWSAPEEVGGHRLEGFWRAHQVPLADVKKNPDASKFSKAGCARKSRRNCSTQNGKLIPELKELAPTGTRRMSANPHANGGLLRRPCGCLTSGITPETRQARTDRSRKHAPLGTFLRDVMKPNMDRLPRLRPGREHVEQAAGHLRGQQEVLDRRVLPGRCRWR